MARHCMRPGCDRPAAARLTYDTEAAAVWLDRPLDDGEPAQQVCSIHAATLTAPLGWTVTDRRLIAVGPSDSQAQSGSPAQSGSHTHPGAASAAASPNPDAARTGISPPAAAAAAAAAARSGRAVAGADALSAPSGSLARSDRPEESAAVDEPDPAKADTANADPAKADTANPERTRSDSPGSGPKSRGKLLDRAFEWTGPQHSVLTTGHDHRPRRSE